MESSIIITEHDYKKLQQFIQNARYSANVPTNALSKLKEELEKAVKVPSQEIQTNVVTMNSRVLIRDLDTGRDFELSIVYPQHVNIPEKKVSILAPMGTALIGYAEGSTVEWEMPNGKKKLLISKVMYQPEANGQLE